MAKKVEELECWQLADRLRSEVNAICAQDPVSRHFRFCAGFTEAAGSVCRNISEGFARYHSAAIVQFFTYALGSLAEVQDYLRESLERHFIPKERFLKDRELAEHTKARTLKFLKFHEQKLRARQSKRKLRVTDPAS
jgi:four helix bundle protein